MTGRAFRREDVGRRSRLCGMGHTTHHAIVIAHHRRLTVLAVHTFAVASGAAVTEILPWVVNGGASFAVLPDGSKDGWSDSKEGDRQRDMIIAYAAALHVEFVEVAFGYDVVGIGEVPTVTRHHDDHVADPQPEAPVIAYTIGSEADYDKAMESRWPRPILKVGRGDRPRRPGFDGAGPPADYLGGGVWATVAEASEVAERGVFLLDAGIRVPAAVYEIVLPGPFDEHTYVVGGGTRLIDDAPVLRKVWPE